MGAFGRMGELWGVAAVSGGLSRTMAFDQKAHATRVTQWAFAQQLGAI